MQLIYDHLIPGAPVWDFCCDHGYMGLNAYESGAFPEVYFVDQIKHIIAQLEERFQREYFRAESSSRAYFLPQPGEDVEADIRGTVVIAGVGAHTIFKIISSLHKKGALRAHKLILVPQRDEEKLVELMNEKLCPEYKPCNEHYRIVERGRSRKVLIFIKNI